MRVLITGGSRGLGSALAAIAVDNGSDVAVVDRAPPSMTRGAGITAINADLADTDRLEELALRLAAAGPFDVVIHNAGINHAGAFDAVDANAHVEILAVNLVAPMVLTARLLASDSVAEGGVLVFVGSLATAVGYPGAASYAASKAGLMNFARNIDGRDGRRCLCVYPGPLKTAHAERNAPRGASDRHRMAPDAAARDIWRAITEGAGHVVPGWRAKTARLLGVTAPWLADRIMRRTVFLPLVRDGSGETGVPGGLAAAVGAKTHQAPAEDVVLAGGPEVAGVGSDGGTKGLDVAWGAAGDLHGGHGGEEGHGEGGAALDLPTPRDGGP